MARKRKTLPKDFEELLKQGDVARLKAVYDACELDARGGLWKTTALGFDECPDELARWLVAQGADIDSPGEYGRTALHHRARSRFGRIPVLLELGADVNRPENDGGTPLHAAADSGNDGNVALLLAHGANPDALDKEDSTPLEYALCRCRNSGIGQMAIIARQLLDAGARRSEEAKKSVREIGESFEFHRSNFHRGSVAATSAALDQLYVLFDVPPVPRRAMHDGKSPIVATAATWQDRHQELWELLVPSSGAAGTVQGEVIRLSGRIVNEVDGNGGVNWDAQFRAMTDAWLAHLRSGTPLPESALTDAAELAAGAKRRSGDLARMGELAVAWVALNPKPVKLPRPPYDR